MVPSLRRDHVLAVLYDMALVVGGEVRLRPLLTRVVQRLLYHTSFPVGLVLLEPGAHDGATRPSGGALRDAELAVAIGDYALTSRIGERLVLPASLLEGPAEELDPSLLDALPIQPRLRGACVKLPIGEAGVLLLAGPTLPPAEVPVTRVFEPLMANLARQIVLCRSHEAHTAALVAERDEARLGLVRFRAAVDTAADLVFLIDPETQRFVDVNGTALATLGLTEGTTGALGLAELSLDLDRERLAELYDDLRLSRRTVTRETVLKSASGTSLPVEVRFTALHAPSLVIASARDLTERRRMEEQLRQAQKLDAIGRLAGGVAHDFNNLLTVILAGTSTLLEDLSPADPRVEELREIEMAAERAGALTKQLLIFSRKNPAAPTLVDLDAAVGRMARMLGRLIGEQIELVLHKAASPTWALVDPSQIEQVVVNLAVNARDAMPEGGRLSIEVSERRIEASTEDTPLAPPGAYAVVAVTDTGIGMSEDTLAHLFEPFFTTKDPGRGTGLGLSTVYGIVQHARGHLRVSSTLGRGSRFEVWLPRADRSDASAPAEGHGPRRGGSETLLLVEDERAVRELTARALRRAGYEVIEASDGADALARVADPSVRVDLLVTDAVMPTMGGTELASRVRERRGALRVLFVSGYARDQRTEEVRDASFLSKPFTIDTLLGAVRAVLDAPAV
jgi:two-component system cell cycle sensor histidine kinase/response regulator CckA